MDDLPLGDACCSADTTVSPTSTKNTANKVFQNIMEHNQEDYRTMTASFHVASKDLSVLASERSPTALADLLEVYAKNTQALAHLNSGRALYLGDDEESSSPRANSADSYVTSLITQLRSADPATLPQTLELAATALTTVLLRSSPDGISTSPTDLEHRKSTFGANSIAPKPMTPFLVLCWDALQDFVLIMLLFMGVVSIVVETTIGLEKGQSCGACWLEGFAILTSVCIVVLVTAGIDYGKQFSFAKLQDSLLDRNTKSVLRGGEIVVVTDADIVVGDVVSVNSHSLASIPADCVLLGPCMDLKMDESSLTGESALVSKKAGDVILSGTNAVQGSGKMVVIAVGIHSVAGQIKARVYESEDQEEDGMAGDEETPLYVKLDTIAKQIAWAGTFAALLAFSISTGIGLGYHKEDVKNLIEYFILAVTVLAVAVPEGLPLAVTLALAFSSNKMMSENNMVKTLAACETMGCATTICTDKTGTLTANKMTARAIYIANNNYVVNNPAVTLGSFVLDNIRRPIDSIIETIVKTISICTMNESVITLDDQGKEIKSSGNPTEVALLHLVQNLGQDYRAIRNATAGRSDTGELADQLSKGKQVAFTSARKMMSWAVPITNGTKDGGYRIYSKGASEVILDRCDREMNEDGKEVSLTQDGTQTLNATAEAYARRGMRCLGLAYRDLPAGVNFDELSSSIANADGSQASLCETDLVFVALVGIEDPLRKEVPDAITKCYQAGIDVRLVTGDSPNTAVSIAFQAGILKDYHFQGSDAEMVAANLKPNVLMEGKDFREKVHRTTVGGKKEFDQKGFDAIWPHLRVLARSSPDDKLTLAHGLNQSCLFEDKEKCAELLAAHNIKIFPDRQVVAMTGDGTNDAPALKRADIGFAMGIAGTQIAKDAADIILIDDNFASIVTAAKWGRNVYASIQKFLQFQLTVNIAAVGTALVGAIVYQKSPLAAIQLLWVNLLMDALASLALASEPPKKELLMRNPVNRSEPMITNRMWTNMIGQASYQILITMLLLFLGPGWFDIPPGDYVEKELKMNSVHYTIIFNAFVWMQLFNEINSRNLKGEVNVFKGLFKNKLFMGILVGTSILQVIMVQLGGKAMHVVDGGLEWKYWGICMGIGFGSLPVQQVINVVYGIIAKGGNKEKREAQVEYHEGGELSPAIVE